MNKNFIFREYECGLSVEETAELCLKTARTIKEWDKGKTIPPECKRLMKMSRGRDLTCAVQWQGFKMHYDRLELPTGQLVSAQQILTGIALLELGAMPEQQVMSKLLKYARTLKKIM